MLVAALRVSFAGARGGAAVAWVAASSATIGSSLSIGVLLA